MTRLTDRLADPDLVQLRKLSGARAMFGEANTSLWHDTVRDLPALPRPGALPKAVDIAIVGGGLTGLWTAYYVKALNPNAAVALFEANHIAFGASGRAGGWAIATLDGQASWVEGLAAADAQRAVACVTGVLDEMERVIASEHIACGYHRGGMVRIAARDESQAHVLAKYKKMICAENGAPDPAVALDSDAVTDAASIHEAYAGVAFPHCAVVNPAKLAWGLAHAVARRGVMIFEGCRALDWDGNALVTEVGRVEAGMLVPALEGYSGTLPVTNERVIPVYSHVIATEPLSANLRASLGLSDRQAFADCSRISTYGQITEDDRVVFGALASYPYAGRLDHLSPSHVRAQYELVHATLVRLWPQLAEVTITHAWSGALGVPRAFRPALIEDRARRIVWGGGYTSRGIAASNLFGRTIAEILCGHETDRTRCPWVQRGSALERALPTWEPDPTRWLAIAAITAPGRMQESVLQSALPAPLRRGLARLLDAIPSAR